MEKRKLKMGMIGGGPGAFIGAVHRIAANMDGEIELIAGCFSSNATKSKQAGEQLGIRPDRVYNSYTEMVAGEAAIPLGQRVDFISIVTPNHLHFAPAAMALQNGFHVVLDKPMTFNLAEAKELKEIAEASRRILCLTHTYTGYPMVKEARQQLLSGKFGKIRKIYVEYPQGWLSSALEQENNPQAAWRTDPSKSGIAGAMGDIGTHAFNLAEYVTGLKTTKICADINIIVADRKLDDDGAVLVKYENGASGVLMATQIAAGEENNIKIRVYAENGGIEWKQEDANTLLVKWLHKPVEIWRAGSGYLSEMATHNCRTPAGHPEGYLEAFANHYRNFSYCIRAEMAGETPKPEWLDFPGIDDGIRGMAFIENVIKSGQCTEKWTAFEV